MVASWYVSLIYLPSGRLSVGRPAPVCLMRREGRHLHHLVKPNNFRAFALSLLILYLLLRVRASDLCRLDVSAAYQSKLAHATVIF